MGITNLFVLLLWQIFYVLPQFDDIFTLPMEYLQAAKGGDCGKPHTIVGSFVFVFFAGVVVRAATMYLLKQLGAVSFVVIKMLKIFFVVLLSSQWVAPHAKPHVAIWPNEVEITWKSGVGAGLVTIGVGLYGFFKIRAKRAAAREVGDDDDYEISDGENEEEVTVLHDGCNTSANINTGANTSNNADENVEENIDRGSDGEEETAPLLAQTAGGAGGASSTPTPKLRLDTTPKTQDSRAETSPAVDSLPLPALGGSSGSGSGGSTKGSSTKGSTCYESTKDTQCY